MKKTQMFVMKKVADEYVLVPRGEAAERMNGVMTLSETATFIYENLENAENAEELSEILSLEYGVNRDEVIEDVKEVLNFLEENEAMTW